MVIKLFLKEKQRRLVDEISPYGSSLKVKICVMYVIVVLQVFNGNSNTIDGCATFFRRDRFSHVKKYEVGNSSCVEFCFLHVYDFPCSEI